MTSCAACAAHARIDPCRFVARRDHVPPPPPASSSATTSISRRSPPRTGTRLSMDIRCCPTRSCPRCTRPAVRRPPPAGGPATSRRGATTRCSARCRSTPRRIRMANTCSTGRGPMPFAGMAAATIRSSSRRFRSRRRRDRGSSPDDGHAHRAARARPGTAARRSRPRSPCYSSLHVLFSTPDEADLCARAGMIVRHGVQFEWQNPGYRDFDDYLDAFNHDKRKKVKQERRRVRDAGIAFRRLVGREITTGDWTFFYDCYESTYRAHHSTPYLSLEFFLRLAASMPDNLLLVIGERNGRPLCAAFDIFDGATLWGRYWGTQAYVPGLHFEACYYQAIEFCIERRISALRRRCARRPQARARTDAGHHVLGARDRRSRFRRRDRRVLRTRARRRRARRRRARGGEPVQGDRETTRARLAATPFRQRRDIMSDPVLLQRDGAIATLTLNRPDVLNVLD